MTDFSARVALTDAFSGVLTKLEQGAQRGRQSLEGIGQAGVSLSDGLGAISAAAVGVFAALKTGEAVYDLTRLGAQAQAVEGIYRNLAAGAGVSADALLASMDRAARGTASNVELMRIANRAFLAGGAELANELPLLYEGARASALATGQEISFVFDTLVKGIVKASPLLIDNAEIYVRVGSSVEAYAQKLGKTTETMTFAERQTAMLQAVMGQLRPYVEGMGADSNMAADDVASLGVAVGELKTAFGELLVQIGLAEGMRRLGGVLKDAAGGMQYTFNPTPYQSSRDQWKRDTEEWIEAQGRRIQAEEDLKRAQTSWQFALTREQSVNRYQQYLDAAKAAEAEAAAKSDASFAALQAAQAAETATTAKTTETEAVDETAEAYKRYTAELTNLRGKQDPAADLAKLGAGLETLPLPQLPKIGTTLATDTNELRIYVGEVARLHPELAQATSATFDHIRALENEQARLAATAVEMGVAGGGLQFLATEAFGAGGSIQDLITNFDDLPPAVRIAINELGGLETAIAMVREEADTPITVDIRVNGLNNALSSLDATALRLAKVWSPEQVRKWRDEHRADLIDHWDGIGEIDQFGLDLEAEIIQNGYDSQVDAELDRNRKIETARQKHYDEMKRKAEEIRQKAEEVLTQGLDVTPEDMALSAAGQYENAPLENARRLQAIMERGFSELTAHPDWAGILGIPAEVMGGTEDQLKAWAARMREGVVDLTRPDMIDWDAFVREFQEDMNREAARENTLNIAVSKLADAGVLGGDMAAIRDKVSDYFGDVDPTAGLVDSMAGLGGRVLSAVTTEFTQNQEGLKTTGKAAGVAIGAAVVEGAREAVGDLRAELARLIAPEVAEIVRRKGAQPLT